MPKEEKTAQKNLKLYQPVDAPSTRQLEWGLWWVERRAFLRRVVVIIFALLNAGLWSYSLYYLIDYGFNGIDQDRQLAQASAQLPLYDHERVAQTGARALSLGPVAVFGGEGNVYDLASVVVNPNTDWYARFEYFFTVGTKTTPVQREFIMPQETKYLTNFLYQGARPSGARVQITNIRWRRVDRRRIGDMTAYLREHLDIAVSDITAGGDALDRVSFTVTNNSPYNYWTVDLYLTSVSGSRLLGVNKYTVEKLRAGDVQNVSVFWSGAPVGGSVTVKPSIDVFDADNYMPFNLGPGQVK